MEQEAKSKLTTETQTAQRKNFGGRDERSGVEVFPKRADNHSAILCVSAVNCF